MRVAPPLPHHAMRASAPRRVLLINPFYPKDPHASFGKHVLTPSLALTSIAGATPPELGRRLLGREPPPGTGRPPIPFRASSGSRVHLTFARRAFELADWYRSRGAVVILGGLHVLSCPDECAPHADALVDRRRRPDSGRVSCAISRRAASSPSIAAATSTAKWAPMPTSRRRAATSFRSTDSSHARASLPRAAVTTAAASAICRPTACTCRIRCAIPRTSRASSTTTDEPYGVFVDNNLGSKPAYLRSLCRALAPLEQDLERRSHDRCHRRSRTGARDGARGVHRCLHRIRVADRREPRRRAEEDASARRLRAPRRAAAPVAESR